MKSCRPHWETVVVKNALYPLLRKSPKLHRTLRLARAGFGLLRHHGIRGTYAHVTRKLEVRAHHKRMALPAGFPAEQTPSLADIAHQKAWALAAGYRPEFALALPLSQHNADSLQETVKSVQAQSYPHWSLLIIRDSNATAEIASVLEQLSAADPRIKVRSATPGTAPCRSLNVLLDGKHHYAGVIREGDRLSMDALFQIAMTIVERPEVDVAYTDEIHLNPQTNRLEAMLLKPDWSPEMLLGYDYLGSFSMVRRSLLADVDGYRPQFGEAQHWDLHLRLMEKQSHVRRVPRCCYFRKSDSGHLPSGTSRKPMASPYRRVLKAYAERQNLPATVESCPNGVHRLRWKLTNAPLVSIIIPNRNSLELIQSIVGDLLHKTTYPNKEIVIVDNASTDAEVHSFYKSQQERGNLRVVPFTEEFNYSAACNAGVRAARGEILLFLANGIEVTKSDWLEELVGWALQPQVGVVGTKLEDPDGNLQHCGVIVGLQFLGHIFSNQPETGWGLFGTAESYRNYLAVTGACQMVRREVFEEIGGFDERYHLASSDIAFCLRCWKKGYRTVCTPFASLIHHEGNTFGKGSPAMDSQLIAREIREMQITEDPYYHPALNWYDSQPTLRQPGAPTLDHVLRVYLDERDPPREEFQLVDWFDDAAIRQQAVAWGVGFELPTYSPADVAENSAEATRFVLHVLRKHENLRERFPRALSEGAEGKFCQWLCTEGLEQFRIPAAASKTIRDVFRKNPGIGIRKMYSFRQDIRQSYPTALLPTGQRRFLHWLLSHGKLGYQFRDEEIWWFCLEVAEDPVREFAFSYRVHQDWQRTFPGALTALGQEKILNWLKTWHHLDDEVLNAIRSRSNPVALDDIRLVYWNSPHWRSKFPLAFRDDLETHRLLASIRSRTENATDCETLKFPTVDASPSRQLGINVLGHFCYPSGLQQSAKSIVQSYRKENVAVALRDVPAHYTMDDPHREEYLDFETHDVSLIHIQPVPNMEIPYLETIYNSAGLLPRSDVYRIGFWYWELDDAPSTWKNASKCVDELWAPTAFIADAMERSLSTKVTPMLPGVEVGEIEPVDRKDFGIEDDQYFFLFMFDMKSIMERKNPLGLIEAYKQAFGRDDRAKLMIKVSSGQFNAEEFARLKHAAHEAGVLLWDEVLDRKKSYGLIQACDCYISLHRSEGLGLTMAEAMLMGKPVIATRYSGNLDFMNDSTSMLVDYQLRQLAGTCPDYVYSVYPADNSWAHPSAEHAATWMRWAYQNQDEAKSLGLRAQEHATRVLSPDAAGKRLKTRLQEISRSLGTVSTHIPMKRAA